MSESYWWIFCLHMYFLARIVCYIEYSLNGNFAENTQNFCGLMLYSSTTRTGLRMYSSITRTGLRIFFINLNSARVPLPTNIIIHYIVILSFTYYCHTAIVNYVKIFVSYKVLRINEKKSCFIQQKSNPNGVFKGALTHIKIWVFVKILIILKVKLYSFMQEMLIL